MRCAVIAHEKPSTPAPAATAEALEITAPEVRHEDDDADDAAGVVGTAAAPIVLQLVARDAGVRIDKVLAQHLPQYSRGRIQHWLEAGQVQLDGVVAHMKTPLFGDERALVLPQPAPEETAFTAQPMALSILYEDAAVIVVDKPAGLVVHPAAGNWSGTLLNGLLHRYPELAGLPRAGIVHRLDKDTSGLMVVARTLPAHTDLVRQLQARSVKRQYLALVWGTPLLNGAVDAAIGRHPRDRVRMAVLQSATAKPAVTHYQRLAQGKLGQRQVSLVQCRLQTGRTHQIRVHMQALGFPLVGDAVYGKPHLAQVFGRQALQAWKLGLVHPVSRKECAWQVPLAADFAALLEQAGIPAPAPD